MTDQNSSSDYPLDSAFLLSQVGGSVATAELVIDEFVNQTPIDLANIEKLLSSDMPAAGKVAHSLKGTSGVFGAKQLRQVAADLELAAKASEAEKSAALFEQLKVEAKRALDFVPQLRQILKG